MSKLLRSAIHFWHQRILFSVQATIGFSLSCATQRLGHLSCQHYCIIGHMLCCELPFATIFRISMLALCFWVEAMSRQWLYVPRSKQQRWILSRLQTTSNPCLLYDPHVH